MSMLTSIIDRIRPSTNEALKQASEHEFLAEAYRRGHAEQISTLIKPTNTLQSAIDLKQFKTAVATATNAERPDRSKLLDIYDKCMYDLNLNAALESRILKILGSRFRVVNEKTKEANPDLLPLLDAQWFRNYLRYAMESEFFGPGVIEIIELDDENFIAKVTLIPRKHFKPKQGIIVKEASDETGWSLDDPRIMRFYVCVGDPASLGTLQRVVPVTIAKNFAMGAWQVMQDKFGNPFRWVTTPSTNDARKKQLGIIMKEMGLAGWGVLNKDEELKLMEMARTDPHKIFDEMNVRCNSEINKYILGQDGTQSHSDNKGTYGSLAILKDVADDRHKADRLRIKSHINNELLWRLQEISPVYRPLAGHYFDWDDSYELPLEDYINAVYKLGFLFELDYEEITRKTGITIVGRRTYSGSEPAPDGGGDAGK